MTATLHPLVTEPFAAVPSIDTGAAHHASMAIIDWLTGLGTSGALRNTSRVLAERRLAEQRVDALVRRLEPAASRDPRRAA